MTLGRTSVSLFIVSVLGVGVTTVLQGPRAGFVKQTELKVLAGHFMYNSKGKRTTTQVSSFSNLFKRF